MPESDIIAPCCSDSILPNWGSIEPHLQRVLTKIDSGHTVDDVLDKLQWRQMQLWNVANWRAIAITQVTILPQHKVLSIIYLSGDGIDDWLTNLVETLKNYAEQSDCKYMELYGRDGWRKKAKLLGFDKTFSVMRFSIDGKQRRR